MRPPHSRGGGCAGGSEATPVATNMSKEAAAADWSQVVYVSSGGRLR